MPAASENRFEAGLLCGGEGSTRLDRPSVSHDMKPEPKSTAAPDPNTPKPKFTPPPLACDAHCHIFGPAAKFPYDPDSSYWPPDSPFEGLQRLHKVLGFERAVIVHASCHGPDMRATLDGIKRSKEAYQGI